MVVSDVDSICRCEVQRVLTSLRGNRKLADFNRGWRELQEASPIRQLSEWRCGPQAAPAALLEIFLGIVQGPEFAGPATHVALEALHAVVSVLIETGSLCQEASELPRLLARVSDAVCGCVFAETSSQIDEATTMQMIAVLRICTTASVGLHAEAFPAALRMKAFEKVLSLWSHYRNSPTLQAGAQSCLQAMLYFGCSYLSELADFLQMVLERFMNDISPELSVERVALYLRCLQRLTNHSTVRQRIADRSHHARIFQNTVPVLLVAVAEHFGNNIRVLGLLLPIVNRICWLCIGNWEEKDAAPESERLVGFGALQVEALMSSIYIRLMNQAAAPIVAEEGASLSMSIEEGTELLVVVLEGMCDLFQEVAVRTLWYSFDADWRRPALIDQVVRSLIELLHTSPNTERPPPASVVHLSATVLMRVISAFKLPTSVNDQRSLEGQSIIQETERRRAAVKKFLDDLEAKPKKARALLDSSGILDFIEVHGMPPPCAAPSEKATGVADENYTVPEAFEEWAMKLVWLLRCWNHAVPYAAMGESFGQPTPDAADSFAAFVDTFDMGSDTIDEALRCLLQAFLLPKEAQQIDRVLKVFAHTYYKKHLEYCRASGHEENVYLRHPDAAYTLAFSVIMLNVDQHNPRLKKRMTLQQFMSNNRGINEGENVPEDVQTRIFESIRKNEIKTPNTGNLAEGVSVSRWADLMYLVEKGYRDNSLAALNTHWCSHTSAFLEGTGQSVHRALEAALATDPSAYSDASSGLTALLYVALSCQKAEADRLADSVVESLFCFGTEVFFESNRGAMQRASQSLDALFLTALERFHFLSLKQLHMLVYITIQFALYGLIDRVGLPSLDATTANLFQIPSLLVDPPTGMVYSLLRKISTVPFRMLAFSEEVDYNASGGKSQQFLSLQTSDDSQEEPSSTEASRESSEAAEKTRKPSDSSQSLENDPFQMKEKPLWPRVEKTFETCGLDSFLCSVIKVWHPKDGEGCRSQVETGGARHALIRFMSSFFLTLRTGVSKNSKDHDLPEWLKEDGPQPEISTPSGLHLPKRALALNVYDGYETLRVALRLVQCTLGDNANGCLVQQADVVPLQELSVSIHIGMCHMLRRNDLGERCMRLNIIAIFQLASALLPLRSASGPVVSLGWPLRLIDMLIQRTKNEPQILVPVARLSMELIRVFVLQVSRFRIFNSIALWRSMLHLLLKAVPTTARALWPGTKDAIVERLQMQLWQHGIIWLLGHPCLLECLSVEDLTDRSEDFWTESLDELRKLAEEMYKNEAGRFLVEPYKALLGYVINAAAPALGTLSSSDGACIENGNARRVAVAAVVWSRVAANLLAIVGQLLPRKDNGTSNEPEQTLMGVLKQGLLHIQVPLLLNNTPHGPQWARSTLEKMLTSIKPEYPIGVLREAVPLLSKFFLQNLNSLQRHENFGQLWLMVLRFLLTLIKRGADTKDELEDIATEAMKNLLCVLVNTNLLVFIVPKAISTSGTPGASSPQNVWWQMTWDCIEVFLPGFCDEFSKSMMLHTAPVGEEGSNAKEVSKSQDAVAQRTCESSSATIAPVAEVATTNIVQATTSGEAEPPASQEGATEFACSESTDTRPPDNFVSPQNVASI